MEQWKEIKGFEGRYAVSNLGNVKAEMFVHELIDYIFAYPDEDYMSMEVLCRKLYKHDLISKKDGEWIGEYLEHDEKGSE